MPFFFLRNPMWLMATNRLYALGVLTGCLMSLILCQFNCQKCPSEQINSVQAVKETLIQNENVEPILHDVTTSSKLIPKSRQDRILCWVLTSPQNRFKAQMVQSTWGNRCDKLLFVSTKNDSSLPTVAIPIGENRAFLWDKVKAILRHLYDNYINDYDWFLKADDDTYVIVENLRLFLSKFDRSKPLFLGREFHYGKVTYMSGGAGYVLTRESVRRFIDGLNQQKCRYNGSEYYEDVNVGRCIEEIGGIDLIDSSDEFGRQRFLPYHVDEFYSGDTDHIAFMNGFGIKWQKGHNCCSEEAITFHYVSGYQMQVYEYLLYRLKVHSLDKNKPT